MVRVAGITTFARTSLLGASSCVTQVLYEPHFASQNIGFDSSSYAASIIIKPPNGGLIIMVRVAGIEPASPGWKPGILAIILHPQFVNYIADQLLRKQIVSEKVSYYVNQRLWFGLH